MDLFYFIFYFTTLVASGKGGKGLRCHSPVKPGTVSWKVRRILLPSAGALLEMQHDVNHGAEGCLSELLACQHLWKRVAKRGI